MSTILPGLPDDVSLQCLIRVLSTAHGILRCVCRRWNQLLSSSGKVRTARAHQGLLRGSIHIQIRDKCGDYRWFALSDSPCPRLRPVAAMPISAIGGAVAADSRLYFIGGSHSGIASKSVWSFDPSVNRWTERARMRVPREFAAAEFIDGKVYVLGGCSPGMWTGSLAWAEVFDPETEKWSTIPCCSERRERWMHGSVALDNRLYAAGDTGGVVYDQTTGRMSDIPNVLDVGWRGKAAAVKGILFSPSESGRIMGYIRSKDSWHTLACKLPTMTSSPYLCAVDDKLYVVGESPQKSKQTSELVLAAIDVQTTTETTDGELHGKTLWCEALSCNFVISAVIHAVSVAV